MPQQPRKSELQQMLEHLRWQHERDMAVIERMAGTLDRVVAGRFDRPQYSTEMPTPAKQVFTADDLTDVLYASSDDEFFRKMDEVTQ